MRALAATMLAASAMAASAAGTPWFALADLRQPRQAALLFAQPASTNDSAASALPTAPAPASGTALSYVPLAPADAAPHAACCLQARGRAKPDTDSGAALLKADTEAPPLSRQAARLSRPIPGPAIAVALDRRHAIVESPAAQTLLIRWPGRAEQLLVQHCTSNEGLHVRITQQGGKPAPAQHFYLPLGMDVEASCPADMMAAPAK